MHVVATMALPGYKEMNEPVRVLANGSGRLCARVDSIRFMFEYTPTDCG